MTVGHVKKLHREISACELCAEHLPHAPRPIVQFSAKSRIAIIGQAPGSKVHASGIPWDDDSGDRLREWLKIDKQSFYNPDAIALVPMGFCYPGKAKGGDQPPRKECAPLWHNRVLAALPHDRLMLLVGSYAQAHYMPETRKLSMTERVRRFAEFTQVIPLPHPAWRSAIWMRKNPWFETEVLPSLRAQVRTAIG
ncbi:MAG: uracil-DNA glycosylase family protein [Erythrobacter sp.]